MISDDSSFNTYVKNFTEDCGSSKYAIYGEEMEELYDKPPFKNNTKNLIN